MPHDKPRGDPIRRKEVDEELGSTPWVISEHLAHGRIPRPLPAMRASRPLV